MATTEKIDTDKEINAGVVSDSDNINGITNVTTIENSTLTGSEN